MLSSLLDQAERDLFNNRQSSLKLTSEKKEPSQETAAEKLFFCPNTSTLIGKKQLEANNLDHVFHPQDFAVDPLAEPYSFFVRKTSYEEARLQKNPLKPFPVCTSPLSTLLR